jgi:LysM repeat protein
MALVRFRPLFHFLAVVLVLACLAFARPAAAQGNEAAELIRLVNELRASQGLEPYVVDPGLMALAQAHSEYQASISTSTHQHSDGRDPPDLGVVENVAGGDLGYLTPYAAVYEVWADPVHGRTMTGYPAGTIGAGVANDGVTVYYTLEVRPAGREAPESGSSGSAGSLITPIPLATLVPSTPRPDGSVVHVVGYGQTLWAIALAYGIRMDQIRAWNNMDADATDIYAGQHLLVLPANLAAASSTPPPEPSPQQNEAVLAAAAVSTAEPIHTLSPPTGTPTAAVPAAAQTTDAAVQEAASASSKAPVAQLGLLAPYLAAGCILIGGVLLLLLRISQKQS